MTDPELVTSEVRRNLFSSPIRSITLALVALAVGAGTAGFTSWDTSRIASIAADQYRAGAFTYQLVGPGGSPVEARKCDSLNAIDGITAAGGVMQARTVFLETQPDAELRVITVTPGYVAAAWPGSDLDRPVNVFAASSMRELGVQPGGSVSYHTSGSADRVVLVDAVASGPSASGEERLIAEVAPPSGSVNSCFVLAEPNAAASVGAALIDFFGSGTSVRQILLRSNVLVNPEALLAERWSQFGWLVGGSVCAVALLGGWVARRNEFALYRLLGLPDATILLMLGVEAALLVFFPSQLGAMIGVSSAGLHLDPLSSRALFVDLGRLDFILLTLPALGYLLLPRGKLLPTLLGR